VIKLVSRRSHISVTKIVILLATPCDIEVAQWLGCCATDRKVAGSIPDGVTGIFH